MRRRRRKNQYVFAGEVPRSRGKSFLLGLLMVLLAVALAVLISNFTLNNQVLLTPVSVTVQNLPQDLENWSILHISDLHGQEIGAGQSAIRKALSGTNYSSVVFTGDLLGSDGDVQPLLDVIALLATDKPKFLIPGDEDPSPYASAAHDSLSVYAPWAQAVMEAGVTILDEPVSILRGKSTIWFVPEYLYNLDLNGMTAVYQKQLDDLSASDSLTPDQSAQKRLTEHHLARLERVRLAMSAMTEKDIQVVLTHTPLTREYVYTMLQWVDKKEIFSLRNAAVVLAGHYAGGQWRLPWGGAVYVPEYGWFPPDNLISGLDYINGIPQYISPGLAASSYYPWQPFRLFNQPEIAYITLTAHMK
ncbi:MAG: hypothetical protein E7316_06895 [Clostridiales bacterium]|nr:hypothetical protein [Clostridiales bacterium]